MSEIPNSELLRIKTRKIEPNPDNPRRLFDDEDMKDLEKSIDERGILVPLIVFRKKGDVDKWVLLDGERRLRCAKSLNLEDVPANEIPHPDRTQNILQMFHIHNVRKDWEIVPTALKLELLIKIFEKEGKPTTNAELSRLTGMRPSRIGECKRILKYKKYLDLSLDKDPEKRIGGDFFSQLDIALDSIEKNYSEIIEEYPREKLVQIMIKKKQDGTIVSFLQEFRTLRKILASKKKGVEKTRIIQNVKEYIRSEPVKDKTGTKTKAMSMGELYDKTSSSVYTESEILKVAKELNVLLSEINYSEIHDKISFRHTLEDLIEKINRVLHSK